MLHPKQERTKNIVPEGYYGQIVRSFDDPPTVVVRINTLKQTIEEARQAASSYADSPDVAEALCFPDMKRDEIAVLGSEAEKFYQ